MNGMPAAITIDLVADVGGDRMTSHLPGAVSLESGLVQASPR